MLKLLHDVQQVLLFNLWPMFVEEEELCIRKLKPHKAAEIQKYIIFVILSALYS